MVHTKKPIVDYDFCMACGICATECPWSCIALRKIDIDDDHKPYPVLDDYYLCTSCTRCEKACPMNAIRMA